MGNILHDWDETQKQALIDKAYAGLPSGGALVVIENIIDDERRVNAFGLLMSLNMLIELPGGFDYTGAQFDGWARGPASPVPRCATWPVPPAPRSPTRAEGATPLQSGSVPRLREVPRSEATAKIVQSMYERLFGDRDPVAEPGTATGTPGDWWTVFANSPDVLEHACRGFALYAQPGPQDRPGAARAGPDPRRLAGRQPVRVLAALQVVPRARASPRRRSRRSRRGSVSDLFSPVERALLAYTDALVLGFGRVDDAVFDAMRAAPRPTRRSSSSPTSR